jgi:hypothetical protein
MFAAMRRAHHTVASEDRFVLGHSSKMRLCGEGSAGYSPGLGGALKDTPRLVEVVAKGEGAWGEQARRQRGALSERAWCPGWNIYGLTGLVILNSRFSHCADERVREL